MTLEQLSSNKAFEGTLVKYKFKSSALGGLDAQFNLFTPPNASASSKAPVLIYLAGLTCTEDNGAQKGSFFASAATEGLHFHSSVATADLTSFVGIALLFPDTSPRGAGALDEDKDWDFGTGAGFYLDATNPAYATHYNMRKYILEELPKVVNDAGLHVDVGRMSIFGHSMGGHGALTLYLNSPTQQFRSASAFAPICNPTECPWGKKAFEGYLEKGIEEAKPQYDATELIAIRKDPVHILVDYGTGDNFYKSGQLLPENFDKAAKSAGFDEVQVRVRSQEGYDHSYFFISTFAADHIHFHANFLKA
ncbi:carbohydrate esterase family 1 protein [Flagelloscypha sp. PMI_526]|nr:carbohydrate esterase family 1 protein [Flagelloscypha sp. PMI_526]